MGYVQEPRSVADKYRDKLTMFRYVLKEKILFAAILLSLLWHLFWVVAVKVVVVPPNNRPVKFSKIAFLGAILPERSALEVRLEPRERSVLERRYLENVEKVPEPMSVTEPDTKEVLGNDYLISDQNLAGIAAAAMDNAKLEPSPAVEDLYI